jgi:environmental stress-induced protein Ves
MRTFPLPSGVRPFVLDELPAEPWRNRGGLTRTIASAAQGREVVWRVSAADVTQAGPFSRFEGMNRTAVLIQGDRLELVGGSRHIAFEGLGHTAHFDGDELLQASVGEQGVRLWNVMTRRGRAMATVEEHKSEVIDLDPLRATFVVVLTGQYLLCSGDNDLLLLKAGEGLDLSHSGTALTLRAVSGDSSLVRTEIYSDI